MPKRNRRKSKPRKISLEDINNNLQDDEPDDEDFIQFKFIAHNLDEQPPIDQNLVNQDFVHQVPPKQKLIDENIPLTNQDQEMVVQQLPDIDKHQNLINQNDNQQFCNNKLIGQQKQLNQEHLENEGSEVINQGNNLEDGALEVINQGDQTLLDEDSDVDVCALDPVDPFDFIFEEDNDYYNRTLNPNVIAKDMFTKSKEVKCNDTQGLLSISIVFLYFNLFIFSRWCRPQSCYLPK